MSSAHEFNVHLIGIPGPHKKILQRVIKLRGDAGISRSYSLTDDGDPAPGKLYVVNSDNDDSIAYWCRRFLDEQRRPRVPTVFAGKRKVKADNVYHVRMPFVASEVLGVFDTITVKEMNYIPELTIGMDSDEMDLSQTFLEQLADSRGNQQHHFTAMVVDDSQPVRKQLEIELKMLGARVELAESGEQALELSRSQNYDIIFLDVMMPGIDGYKVCKILKKDVRSKNTPIVMLTGKSSPFDKVKGTLSGCDTYLTKPLQHEEFQNVTRKYLPHAAESRQLAYK